MGLHTYTEALRAIQLPSHAVESYGNYGSQTLLDAKIETNEAVQSLVTKRLGQTVKNDILD